MSGVVSAVDIPLTFDSTLGAVLIGFSVACIIYGILLTMVYTYFRRYPEDRPIYKYLVYLLLVLETADQIFIAHIIYFYGIRLFGQVQEVLAGRTTWSFILQQTVGAIVGFIVKTAFAMRVWRFSERNYWVTGLILILTFGQLGVAITYSAKAFQLSGVFEVVKLQLLGTISLGIGVATDMAIALALCLYLRKLKTGYRPSDSLVNTLLRFAINTGVVTSAVSVTTLLLYNIMPHNNLIFVATYFILSKLYAISFLATLNTRRVVRGRGTDRNHSASASHGGTGRHSNLFHLGTRMPSVGGGFDLEGYLSPKDSTLNSSSLASPSKSYQPPDVALETLGYAPAVVNTPYRDYTSPTTAREYVEHSDQGYFYAK